jgi:hypothetical protein
MGEGLNLLFDTLSDSQPDASAEPVQKALIG